jgi:TRAP-type C4-dicarboxylate transport system permease small subunit
LFELVVCGLAVAISLILIIYGTRTTWQFWVEGRYDYFKLAEIPVAPIYAIIPIGSALLLIQLFRDIATELKEFGQPKRAATIDPF